MVKGGCHVTLMGYSCLSLLSKGSSSSVLTFPHRSSSTYPGLYAPNPAQPKHAGNAAITSHLMPALARLLLFCAADTFRFCHRSSMLAVLTAIQYHGNKPYMSPLQLWGTHAYLHRGCCFFGAAEFAGDPTRSFAMASLFREPAHLCRATACTQ